MNNVKLRRDTNQSLQARRRRRGAGRCSHQHGGHRPQRLSAIPGEVRKSGMNTR